MEILHSISVKVGSAELWETVSPFFPSTVEKSGSPSLFCGGPWFENTTSALKILICMIVWRNAGVSTGWL